MARVDGLTMGQLKGLREKARLLDIPVAEAMPYRHGQDWSEGLVLSADTMTLASLARDVSLNYPPVARALERMLDALAARSRRLHLKTGELPLTGEAGAVLMGILNVTPDSFSDGGEFLEPDAAVAHALEMAREGARIIDVGGESTRPSSRPVPLAEELSRIVGVIEKLRAALPPTVHISVDTMKAEVARAAVGAGAEIINDVSGLAADPSMRATAADLGVHVIINHMKGTPQSMQEAPLYRHVIPEIIADLMGLTEAALQAGIGAERILLDPGIGFGKRVADNMAILRHMAAFVSLGKPVVIGVSRKSFLAAMSPGPEGASAASPARADATMVAETIAALGGAHILRTHDPARAALAARLSQAVSARGPGGSD
jgi:dihydropteroate synthase